MAEKKTGWTPYGLEAIRIAHLRRRRRTTLLVALGLALLWAMMFTTTTDKQLELSTDGGSNRATLDFSDELRPREDGPLTVSISPGQVTRAETGTNGAPTSSVQRFDVPAFERDAPISWRYYAILYGPYFLIGAALYMLARRPPKHEVNYGIYKGAMPYEMITATAAAHVRTTREARTSIFGKRRVDHLPPELLVERVAQEE